MFISDAMPLLEAEMIFFEVEDLMLYWLSFADQGCAVCICTLSLNLHKHKFTSSFPLLHAQI